MGVWRISPIALEHGVIDLGRDHSNKEHRRSSFQTDDLPLQLFANILPPATFMIQAGQVLGSLVPRGAFSQLEDLT